jgi:predicted DNA-binding protein with PD1-like motif
MADRNLEVQRLEFAERGNLGHCFTIRLGPGQDLIARVRSLLHAKDCRRAAILSGIGSLCNVTFRNLAEGAELPLNKDSWADTKRPGPFELVSLTGNVIPLSGKPVPHLHAVLGSPDGSLVGGHVFAATVFGTVELVIVEINNSMTVRSRDEMTGMAEIKLAE